MAILDEMLWKLTSRFTKNPNSNVGKLLKLFAEQYELIEKDLQRQLDWKDINKAEGAALDEIGKIAGVPRGTWDDPQYRIRIKTGIARNISSGTINNVIEILSSTLNIDPSSMRIESLWPIGKHDTIKISKIPYASLNEAGLTQEELITIVKVIVAAGIDVETLELEGTFRFSSIKDQNEIDVSKGFYNEATGTGGKFGAIMSV